mmetsp:Transcript_10776/g.44847  ORF Transcript_10776/g.44847 Transcript_10776/m.44847 type:complete len:246 (+) Transcript_10776:81-818(+)
MWAQRRSPCPTPSKKPSTRDFTAGSSSPTRRRPARTAPSTPRSTSTRPTAGFSRVSPTSTASSTPRRSRRSPSAASAPATTPSGTSSPWTFARSSTGRRSRARRSTRRSRRRRRRRRWRRSSRRAERGPGPGPPTRIRRRLRGGSPCSTIWFLTARMRIPLQFATRCSRAGTRRIRRRSRGSATLAPCEPPRTRSVTGSTRRSTGNRSLRACQSSRARFTVRRGCPYRGTTRCSTRGRSDGAPSP